MYELVNKLTSRQRIFVQASAISLLKLPSAAENLKAKISKKRDKILVKDIISKTSLSRLLVFFYTRLLNKPDYLTTKL